MNTVPCKSVSNQNYRMYIDNFANEEQRRLESIELKEQQARAKAFKLKIQMETRLNKL